MCFADAHLTSVSLSQRQQWVGLGRQHPTLKRNSPVGREADTTNEGSEWSTQVSRRGPRRPPWTGYVH